MSSSILKLDENAQAFIDKLVEISPNLTNEALGEIGVMFRREMIALGRNAGVGTLVREKRMTRHSVFQKQGSRLVRGVKPFFSRVPRTSGFRKPDNMTELIRFKVYHHSHTLLVGFMNVKSWSDPKYEKGVKVGDRHIRGTGGRNKLNFKALGQQLEYGGRVDLSPKQRSMFRYSGMGAAASRGYVMKKAHPIVRPAFRNKKDKAVGVLERTINDALVGVK